MANPMLKPMLCESIDTAPIGTNAWYCEEKFDGWRAIVHNADDGIHVYGGRNGADYTGQVPYVEAELAAMLPPDTIIDGELVGANGWGDVQGAMTRTQPSQPGELELVVFDLIQLCTRDIRGVYYEDRRAALEDPEAFYFGDCEHVRLTPQLPPSAASHANVVASGGEGTVWKRAHSPYTSGRRSHNWNKWKHEDSDDFICTGFHPGKGEFAGMVGAIEFELPHAPRIQVRPGVWAVGDPAAKSTASGMDMATRQDMTANPAKYIGQMVEIKHNGVMKSGKLRHPQYLRLRSDKAPARPRRTAPTPARSSRGTSGRPWMRNYGAMLPDKLRWCIQELESQRGDAYDRVVERGGDLQEHIAAAKRAAAKKGI